MDLIPTDLPTALCLVNSPILKRILRGSLAATNTVAEFCTDPPETMAQKPSMIFIDAESRREIEIDRLERLLAAGGRMVVLGETIESGELCEYIRRKNLDHVIGETTNLDEVELVITTAKLLSGDIFGIEKYVSWGALVSEVDVTDYTEKRSALREITKFAQGVGARRTMLGRIENVCDELLMNALYDAPRVHREVIECPDEQEIPSTARVRWASDGRYFAISVEDHFGALKKDAILRNLINARQRDGRPIEGGSQHGGAGLGLYFILSSVTRFVANIESGRRTEVICLFDLKQRPQDRTPCAMSLHVFHRAPAAS